MKEPVECACAAPSPYKRAEVAEWRCSRCGLVVPLGARPSQAIEHLLDRTSRLETYADFVREFGEPTRTTSLAQLRDLRARLASAPPQHPHYLTMVEFLARPEVVLEAWWSLEDGAYMLRFWEDAAGTTRSHIGDYTRS
jgi:hypothetical protein